MPTGAIPTRRGTHPLPPPIPVRPAGGPAQSSSFACPRGVQESISPHTPSGNGSWESDLTISPVSPAQTVLPVYSSTLDLGLVVEHLAIAPSNELSHESSNSPVTPSYDPPPYSYISSLGNPLAASISAALSQGDPTPGSGGSSAIPSSRQQQRSSLVQYRLYLKKDGAAKPWATLRLINRAPPPNSKGKVPTFTGGDLVEGALELDLGNPMSVQNITIKVKGRLITSYSKQSAIEARDYIILGHVHEVYSEKAHGDPGHWGQCNISKNRKPDGKMQGSYHFPFSFAFPTEVTVGDGRNRLPTATYELPPSFSDRGSDVTVRYDIGLTISHGKMKMNMKFHRVGTNIVYTPKLVAPPASEKRQIAYWEGAHLPGPGRDPTGWHSIPTATISGRFQGRKAQVSSTLWLAKPLCYTRGTVLPCYLKLSGVDTHLLEHLASPEAIDLHLVRYVSFCKRGDRSPNAPRQNIANNEEVEFIGTATWWRPPRFNEPEEPSTRWLEGEIHLSGDLHPSCNYPRLIIEYYVEMMPFLSNSFTTDGQGDYGHPVARQCVKIATFHQYGPIPTAFRTRSENEGNA